MTQSFPLSNRFLSSAVSLDHKEDTHHCAHGDSGIPPVLVDDGKVEYLNVLCQGTQIQADVRCLDNQQLHPSSSLKRMYVSHKGKLPPSLEVRTLGY